MRLFKKVFLGVVCCLTVSGCESMEGMVRDFDSMFTMTREAEEDEYGYMYEDPDIAMTYPQMAREMSGGSVHMYGLDGPVMPAPAPSGGYAYDGGVPSSIDPNVTVYPFDGGGIQTPVPAPQARRPVLQPPSEQMRPLQSPFNGPIQSPARIQSSANAMAPVTMPVPAPAPLQSLSASPATSYPSVMLAPDGTSRVYYRHGSSSLDRSGRQVLDHVAQRGGYISVAGHASERAGIDDPVERSIVNLKMSLDRAFKVSSDLIRKGVPASQIETKAYGATRPAMTTGSGRDEAVNRRVEISTTGGVTARPVLPPSPVVSGPVSIPLSAPPAPQTRSY